MPEKENTIRFAGRDVDRNEFVRRAQAKVNQWMDYQMLQGDERTDFMNSFNTILQGVVDGTYSVSELGKINGISGEENLYKEKNGQRTDTPNGTFRSHRVGFNPSLSVETYLNGVASSMKAYKVEETPATQGKKWQNTTMIDQIANAIFGEGNSRDLGENGNRAQLEAWANQYDPYTNGTRGVTGRTQFIKEILNQYQQDLLAGKYNISDEDKQKELDRIAALSGNPSEWELGKIAPWMTHLLFAGEKYMTSEEQIESNRVNSYRNFITNGGNNPIDQLTDPTGYQQLNQTRLQQLYQNYKQYQNNSKVTNISFNINSTGVPLSTNEQNAVKSLTLNQILKGIAQGQDEAGYYYFDQFTTKIGNKYYLPDWEKGRLFIVEKGQNTQKISVEKLSDAIKSAGSELEEFLFKSYMEYNNENIPLNKQGGVIKALRGAVLNIPPDEEINPQQPQNSSNLQTTSAGSETSANPTVTTNSEFENGSVGEREEGSVGTAPDSSKSAEDKTIPSEYKTNRTPKSQFAVNPSDAYITMLENLKASTAKQTNRNVYNIMNGIRNFHATPIMEHYKQYTSKPLEDQIATNNATFNQLGNNAAAGTSDQGAAHAYQINYRRQAAMANNPLITKQADDTRASIDKENETAQRNNLYRHQVGEQNRQSDIALHNTRLHMLAELYSKNGAIDVNNLQSRQHGAAVNAEQNYNRDRAYTIQNDPKVRAAQAKIDALEAKRYSGEGLTDEEKQQYRQAQYELQQAVREATTRYDGAHLTPTGTPYAGYGTIYQTQAQDPFPIMRDGGKMLAAEQEKTKRAYSKMFHDMLKMTMKNDFMNHRDAYNYYRKLIMQSK